MLVKVWGNRHPHALWEHKCGNETTPSKCENVHTLKSRFKYHLIQCRQHRLASSVFPSLTNDIQHHRDGHRLVPLQLAGKGDSVVILTDGRDTDRARVEFVARFQIHCPLFSVPEQLFLSGVVLNSTFQRFLGAKPSVQNIVLSSIIHS